MTEEVYRKLADVLNTLPNGFPATEDGVEIRLLKKIFSPEEAAFFCELKLKFETPLQIADRIDRPLSEVSEILAVMSDKGQIFGVDLGEVKLYKMMPWAFGIYELQLPRMDRELAEMCEHYNPVFGAQFFAHKPQLMQVIPIESEIADRHETLSYERVSTIIENSRSFMYFDCICKKEKGLLDRPCTKPVQVCMAFAPIPGLFDNHPYGKTITREEAYDLIKKTEEAGLVHLTWNVRNGHYFICNCCGCCCGILRGINELGIDASCVINAAYCAVIDPEACTGCGVCADERCQVHAIVDAGDIYEVTAEKCIGCGLCVTTCPADAVSLMRRDPGKIDIPPADEMDWYDQRAGMRGMDISAFK
jgi:Na+-translocating ferredoxin:NAD+ oxidoreductase subunit B